jgi:hypothetical protein
MVVNRRQYKHEYKNKDCHLAGLPFIIISVLLGLYFSDKAEDFYRQSTQVSGSEKIELLIKSDFLKPSNEKKSIIVAQYLELGDAARAQGWMERINGYEKFIYLTGLNYELNREQYGNKYLDKVVDAEVKSELERYRDFLKGSKVAVIMSPKTDYGRVINYFAAGEVFNAEATYSYLGARIKKGIDTEPQKIALAKKVSITSPGLSLALSKNVLEKSPTNKEALIIRVDSLGALGNDKETLEVSLFLIRHYPEVELIANTLTLARELNDPRTSEIEEKLDIVLSSKKAQ